MNADDTLAWGTIPPEVFPQPHDGHRLIRHDRNPLSNGSTRSNFGPTTKRGMVGPKVAQERGPFPVIGEKDDVAHRGIVPP